MKDRTKLEDPGTLACEYWEVDGSIYGALVHHHYDGLLMLATRDMSVGNRLHLRILYGNGYELDDINLVARIVAKTRHTNEDWRRYEYQLELDRIAEQDRRKLTTLLGEKLRPRDTSRSDQTLAAFMPPEIEFPVMFSSGLTMTPSANCRSYRDGRCSRTRSFCDLCQNKMHLLL